MKNNIYALIMIVLFSLACNGSAAAEKNQEIEQSLKSAQFEIQLLKKEVQVMQSYQDDFLSTVYWTLGTVAAVAGLLVGFSWFTNSNTYEKDKSLLKSEIVLASKEQLQTFRQEVDETLKNIRQSIPDEVKKTNEESINNLKKTIGSNHRQLISELFDLQMEIRELEYDKWHSKGIFVNAIRAATEMLEVSVKHEREYRISDALDLIQTDLKLILSNGKRISSFDADDMSRIVKILDKVAPQHAILVESIKSTLLKVQALV